MVEDIGQQRIVFDNSEDFYRKYDTPDGILDQTPLILDPSNPYNNVMTTFSPLAQHLFRDGATESLKRLEKGESQIEMDLGFPQLKEIFLPQMALSPRDPVCMPQRWLIGLRSRTAPLQPRVKHNVVLNKTMESQTEQFRKAFSAFVFVFDIESNYEHSDEKSVQHSLEKIIDHLFESSLEWTPSQDSHGNFDVTFKIPIGPHRVNYVILSFDWQ